jgi:hypothetical protein
MLAPFWKGDAMQYCARLGHLWTLALRHYIHLYFFRNTTYFGVVSGVFLVLDAGFVLKSCILVFPVFIEPDFKLSYILCTNY